MTCRIEAELRESKPSIRKQVYHDRASNSSPSSAERMRYVLSTNLIKKYYNLKNLQIRHFPILLSVEDLRVALFLFPWLLSKLHPHYSINGLTEIKKNIFDTFKFVSPYRFFSPKTHLYRLVK